MPDAVMIVEVPSLRVVFANQFAETLGARQLGRLPRNSAGRLRLTAKAYQVSRYVREYRKYQRTQSRMTASSKCTPAEQRWPFSDHRSTPPNPLSAFATQQGERRSAISSRAVSTRRRRRCCG